MESTSKDVLFTIAMKSELPDLLRWCESSKKIYRDVCNNDDVWRAKLLKEYPDYNNSDIYPFLSSLSPRETYVFMYQLSYIKKLSNWSVTLKDIYLKKELFLDMKKLKKIPSFNLPNLRRLYLNYNHLTKVPSFELPNLQELYLSGNQLTEVPNFALPNLKILALSHNQLTEVPNFMFPNLQFLYITGNQLTQVPNFNLPKLQILSLENNQLKEIPNFVFPKLATLYLKVNNLTEASKEEIKERYGNKVSL